MSTALTIPLGEIQTMALAVAKSGLFGIKTSDQALALMLVAQAEGRHPVLAARDYDIIQGRPAKKSEAMLRDFLESGGKVEWHTLDDTIADATFSHPMGGTCRIDWTMKRAVAAGLGGKDMYKKFPRQMLRSRTVSEGIRTVCPMATSGMCVPEEVSDFRPVEKEINPIAPITPTSGAGDGLSAERCDEIKTVVEKVKEWIKSGSIGDAVAETQNANMEADEYVYFWTFFNSKSRAAMKAENERIKAAQKPAPALISDAQKKRLEARIHELKIDREDVKSYAAKRFSKEHFAELDQDQYDILYVHLDEMAKPSTSAAPASPDPREPSPSPAGAGAVAGAPSDDALIEQIDAAIGKRKFKTANDLSSLIADEERRENAVTRITAAYEATIK